MLFSKKLLCKSNRKIFNIFLLLTGLLGYMFVPKKIRMIYVKYNTCILTCLYFAYFNITYMLFVFFG